MSNRTTERSVWAAPVLMGQSLLIVAVNIIALIVFSRKEFIVKKSNYLLMNLCVCDMLVGVWVFVYYLDELNYDTNWALYKANLGSLTDSMVPLCFYMSMFSLAGIAAERAFAVFIPFKHRFLDRRYYFISIAVIWFLGIAVEAPVILSKLSFIYMQQSDLDNLAKLLRVISGFSSFGILVCCYSAVLFHRRFGRRVRGNKSLFAKDNARLTRTVLIVTVVSFLCLCPLGGFYIYVATCTRSCITGRAVQDPLVVILYFNSFLNVVVYAYRMSKFRKALRHMFCKCLVTHSMRVLTASRNNVSIISKPASCAKIEMVDISASVSYGGLQCTNGRVLETCGNNGANGKLLHMPSAHLNYAGPQFSNG
ncbi:sphingosine 1-phosphate receptor 3 [Nematostella vectensis]|uniref:sphingosine 1-phosphate receptor 3 n=1 Tax=Nematostella vectensis TaxID=45351 RepID=UPI00138FF02A|nr:sphingosine 1-phosphate receptor 3 [Nematostella vectensis]